MRNLAFLALAAIIGLVVYAALNVGLNELMGPPASLVPLSAGASVAIASFVAGAQLGGRVKTDAPHIWGLSLGAVLASLIAAPLVLLGGGYSLAPISALPLLLVVVSAFLGVRATARRKSGPGSNDA
jgi:hypothetical protein